MTASPHKVWSEGSISVVDYGCGQCIAEMVLSDFLNNHYIDNDKISDFTVINDSVKFEVVHPRLSR